MKKLENTLDKCKAELYMDDPENTLKWKKLLTEREQLRSKWESSPQQTANTWALLEMKVQVFL
jgi:hypothetical protein